MPAAKKQKADQACLAASSASKAAISRILLALHAQGCLIDGIVDENASENSLRLEIGTAVKTLGDEATPFGKVMQTIQLETDSPGKPFTWPFIHPLALVYALSKISSGFARIMKQCIDKLGTRAMRVVLYVDEVRPGNVLRPDAGRAVSNVFWPFADWPEWYLKRDDAWLTFGCIRSGIVNKTKGAMSGVMKHVLHQFFAPSGPNFATSGGLVEYGGETILFKAVFAGFLGGEKGLKEVFASKGPSSSRPCLGCKSLCQFIDPGVMASQHYLIGIDCPTPANFDRASDSEIYDMVDMLKDYAANRSNQELMLLEQTTGLHYEPHGLLYDEHCRSFVLPVSGYLRDWMHMLAVSGVANVELEQLVRVLGTVGVKPQMLTDFFARITLPKASQKVDPEWFTVKRLGRPSEFKDGWKGFSSELLVIVPIVRAFLEFAVAPMGVLSDNIRCFRLLDRMIKLFSLGAEKAVDHIDTIDIVIKDHARLFAALYGHAIKPKYHHLFHVLDHMRQTRRLLSCWVTERKHRVAKGLANHMFRHFEVSLTRDMLAVMVHRFGKAELFVEEYLVSPRRVLRKQLREVAGELDCFSATKAMLRCGTVCKSDIIMLSDARVAVVDGFFAAGNGVDAPILCIVRPHTCLGPDLWQPSNQPAVAVPSADILEALAFFLEGDAIRVLPPQVAATR